MAERQILFRGKRVDNDEWVYGFLTQMWAKYHIVDEYNENVAYEVVPGTVGQYTGLTDKNGKKIFEGDIVSVTTGIYGYKSTYHSATQTVRYEADSGIAVFLPFDNSDMIEAEVIGNIYDNKEEQND